MRKTRSVIEIQLTKPLTLSIMKFEIALKQLELVGRPWSITGGIASRKCSLIYTETAHKSPAYDCFPA